MKIIVNADDFGMSTSVNKAIEDCFEKGVVTDTSLITNLKGYKDAVDKILAHPDWSAGIHLNIVEGSTVDPKPLSNSLLYNKYGEFNHGFLEILLRSGNSEFLYEVEKEFRLQIEKFPEEHPISSLDSHVHVHAIPAIFEIACKLAKEYNIPFVRTQFEYFYEVPGIKYFFMPKYYINLLKIFILKIFTIINRGTIKKYELDTNDAVIGVGYTGMMNEYTVSRGISKLKREDGILEVICHPDKNIARKSNYDEYLALTNKKLIKYLSKYQTTSYQKAYEETE